MKTKLLMCVSNSGFESALKVGDIYVQIKDEEVESFDLVKVFDESGDHYLYPKSMFKEVNV